MPDTPTARSLYRDERNTAPETIARYDYQFECAALRCIPNLAGGEIESIHLEWATDYALVADDGTAELVSVKHREPGRGDWTFARLVQRRVLSDLHLIWREMGEQGSCVFESNAGFDPDLLPLVVGVAGQERDRLIARLAEHLGVQVAEAGRFAAALVLPAEPTPRRKEITDIGVRRMAALLEEWGQDPACAQECYELVVSRIRRASTDAPPSPAERLDRLKGLMRSVRERTRVAEHDAHVIRMGQLHDLVVSVCEAAGRARRCPIGKPHYQLPNDVRMFVGRDRQIQAGLAALTDQRAGTTIAVTGPPGIGKTMLAVRLAHHGASHRFSDGRLFVRVPRSDGQDDAAVGVVTAVLDAVDTDGADAAATHQQRVGRLSSLLAGRAVLLVLDDVTCEAQVRQMQQIAPHLSLVCTSRSRLSGLVEQDVTFLELDPLSVDEAAKLADATAGTARLAAEESRKLGQVCGGLPLAVRIAASRLARRPRMSVEQYLSRLASTLQ